MTTTSAYDAHPEWDRPQPRARLALAESAAGERPPHQQPLPLVSPGRGRGGVSFGGATALSAAGGGGYGGYGRPAAADAGAAAGRELVWAPPSSCSMASAPSLSVTLPSASSSCYAQQHGSSQYQQLESHYGTGSSSSSARADLMASMASARGGNGSHGGASSPPKWRPEKEPLWAPQSAVGRNFVDAHPTTPKLADVGIGTSARFRRGLARELERRIATAERELSLAPDATLTLSAARGALGRDLRVLRAQYREVAETLRPAG